MEGDTSSALISEMFEYIMKLNWSIWINPFFNFCTRGPGIELYIAGAIYVLDQPLEQLLEQPLEQSLEQSLEQPLE